MPTGTIGDLTYWTNLQSLGYISNPTILYFGSWIVIILLSLVVLWYQIKYASVFDVLYRYQKIKSNMGSWVGNILEFEGNTKSINKEKSKFWNNNVRSWGCHDAGTYYIPLRLGGDYLPESITRGNGGAWKISKGPGYDAAAYQFCKFIIRERSSDPIQCGLDSFYKTGNSGLFDFNHWCRLDWDIFVRQFTV